MLYEVSLTVAESKRLVAKGVAALPAVRQALKNGTVAIATGSTNGYVVEEVTGRSIEKPKYMTGATLPSGVDRGGLLSREVPDVVLRNGKPVENLATTDAVKDMGVGDVFMKGANALHYETRRAGVLIGHPTGGTVGAILGTVTARRITLIVPVGLEKCVAQPLEDVHVMLHSDPEARGSVPSLWPLNAEVVTEIEALKILTGVDAVQSGAGGLAGAEGAVWLLLRGTEKQIEDAETLLESVRGEPPFVTVA
jgi:hypothetical protein